MKVKNILDSKGRKIFTISEDTTVYNVVSELSANKIGFLIATNASGNVTGVISERDVVHKCVNAKKDPAQMKASEIMTPKANLITASEEDDIESIMPGTGTNPYGASSRPPT